MANKHNIELVDNIRNSAVLLMKERPDLSYADAYEMVRRRLLGDTKVTDYVEPPLKVVYKNDSGEEVVLYEEMPSMAENKPIKEHRSDGYSAEVTNYYEQYVRDNLPTINPYQYTIDQLKSLVVAHKMEVDISLLADPNYSPKQIDFLAIMAASGRDIQSYKGNYTFEPTVEFEKQI